MPLHFRNTLYFLSLLLDYSTLGVSRSAFGTDAEPLSQRGKMNYPYHGGFGNKPPPGYTGLYDPLSLSGRDLRSVSSCTQALGFPKLADCRLAVEFMEYGMARVAYEQGVQTEHLEPKYLTLPRIYSYG